ncbi:MAG: hypothetical protein ACYC35_05315 [Pirellulales bacterium]
MAEHVYQDVSGKKVIAGTFDRVRFTRKPLAREVEQPDGTKQTLIPGGMHGGSPFAYVSLTDVCEGTKLVLQFVNLTRNVVLFGKEVIVHSTDRLAMVELVFPLPPLGIQEPGGYALEVVCEGDILGSWRIRAEELATPREG